MTDSVTRRGFVRGATLSAMVAVGLRIGSAQSSATDFDRRVNRRRSFDDGWRFSRGDFAGAEHAEFDDRQWADVTLPHDWSITGPYSRDEPCGGSGGYLPTGVGWYRKRFTLPSTSAQRRIAIVFDGVYQRSEVFINGRTLGLRPNGYISFVHDLTPHLMSGGASNVLAVRVDNSLQPNSRWYSGSGITRHTWLLATDPIHVALWGVCVRTIEISPLSATVEVTTRIANESARDALCTLVTAVRDARGRAVANLSSAVSIRHATEQTVTQRLAVDQPTLWDLTNSHQYTLVSTVRGADQAFDEVENAFGIRDARFDAERGFILNGERIKLNGVCLHHDCGAVGAAVPERMWERRLTLLKGMGCNAIRTSHNPPAPEFLELCDRLGFLVMDEAFDEWRQPKLQTPEFGYHRYFDAWAPRDLADMIDRDRNHPAIVIWSAGNEVPDQTDPTGATTLQGLLDIAHTHDPTRPVTVGCDDIAAEPKAATPEFLSKLDVVGYNYVDRWRERRELYYSLDRQRYPQRRFIGTESSALGGVRGPYRLEETAPLFGERSDSRRVAIEQLQKFVQIHDYVSGDFMWTGIDYLGESLWPNKLASSGVLDTCGFPKDGYYFYQSLWTREPVLHLFPHWNWGGREGQIIPVGCFTNCDTVELFLDERSFGVKGFAFPRPGMQDKYGTYPVRAKALQTTADLFLAWDVPYAPGVLKAVGRRAGEIVATSEVRTTGAAAAIRLSVDRDHIGTDRGDVAHVKVEITDSAGQMIPTADHPMAFSLLGPGRILGVDNGQPDSHEPYQASERRAFNGLALVLVQSAGVAGRLLLSATSAGLADARIEIWAGRR